MRETLGERAVVSSLAARYISPRGGTDHLCRIVASTDCRLFVDDSRHIPESIHWQLPLVRVSDELVGCTTTAFTAESVEPSAIRARFASARYTVGSARVRIAGSVPAVEHDTR